MKRGINILLIILVSISFLLTITSFTILNKNFLISRLKKYDYYNEVYNDIINELDNEYQLNKKELIKDINNLTKNRFTYNIHNQIKPNNKISNKVYLYNVNFKNSFKNIDVDMIANIIYILNLIFVIITGFIFLKTAKIHNVKLIFFYSSIISFINYILIKVLVNIDYEIFNKIVMDANKYYLGVSIIIFEIIIFNNIKNKIKL